MLVIERFLREHSKDEPMSIFVGGTLKRATVIESIAKFFRYYMGYAVEYANPMFDIDQAYPEIVEKTYGYIHQADAMFMIPKHDGTLGEASTHEVMFARYVDTPVYILSNKDISYIKAIVAADILLCDKILEKTYIERRKENE